MKEIDKSFSKIMEPTDEMDNETPYNTHLTTTFKQLEP